MKIQFVKRRQNAVLPKFAHDGDQCFDLTASSCGEVRGNSRIYHTGLSVNIPKGYGLDIFIRSGLSFNNDFILSNGVAKIDQGYIGEIDIKITYMGAGIPEWPWVGDRIAQAQLVKLVKTEIEWSDELSETTRGENGFGSSGK